MVNPPIPATYGARGPLASPEIDAATSLGEVASAMHVGQPGHATGCARLGRSLMCLLFLPFALFWAVFFAPLFVFFAGLALCWPSLNEKNSCFRRLVNESEMMLLWPAYSAQQICWPEPWEDDWSQWKQRQQGQQAATAV